MGAWRERAWVGFLTYVWRSWPRRTTAAVVLTLVLGLYPAVFSVVVGELVGAVPAASGAGAHSVAGRHLIAVMLVFGAAVLGQLILNPVWVELTRELRARLTRDLRSRLLVASLGPRGIGHLEQPDLRDKVEQTRSGAAGFGAGAALSGLFQQLTAYVSLVGGVALLATYRWWLPIPPVLAMVVVRRVMRRRIFAMVDETLRGTASMRRAAYFSDLALGPAAAKELRVFGLGEWLAGQYRQLWRAAMEPIWRARAGGAVAAAGAMLLGAALEVATILWVVDRAVSGALSLGRLAVLLGGLATVHGSISFGSEAGRIAYGLAAYTAILDVEQTVLRATDQATGDRPAGDAPQQSIRFEGVGFHYPGTSHQVYESLDLEIRAGERLAIVGLNGAGKTTLVKLLARLYEPTSGRITADGVPLNEIDPEQWQGRCAAIFQDFAQYPLTAEGNITIGAPEADLDADAVQRAAGRAGAVDVLERLPQGADTLLSRQFEGGVELSGGQWQRVALARAFYAVEAGASVLILDEPTASLDIRAEANFYERFLELTEGVTTIVISHRFATVRRADRIAVLDGGRITELGSHDDLVAQGGQYARLFRLQSQRYLGVAEAADDRSVDE